MRSQHPLIPSTAGAALAAIMLQATALGQVGTSSNSPPPASPPPAKQPAATPPAAPPTSPTAPTSADTRILWTDLAERDRTALLQLLEAPDWAIRAIAVLRLERYSGPRIGGLLRARVRDDASWQVRCFALRVAHRLDIPIAAEDLGELTDGRVMRAALRHGVDLPDETVQPLALKLLRTKGVEELMLGIELAAACDIQEVRDEASRRLITLIRNMDDAVCALVSRRLQAVFSIPTRFESANEWRLWLGTHPPQKGDPADKGGPPHAGNLPGPPLPAAGADPRVKLAAPPLVAELENETFIRLIDYLDGLRQRDLDLVIVMDATASMIPMVNEARAGIDSLILFLSDLSREMRLAFVAYRDHDNQPVWDGQPFTSDILAMRKYLFGVRITGGADYPEAVLEGLEACAQLKWNPAATREVVLVGDAPPHEEDVYEVHVLIESMREAGVTVHAAHVPMEYGRGHLERLSPMEAVEARRWIEEYNQTTGEIFAAIAEAGGGRKTEMARADELVPSIMHFTIEESWWPVFDEFYELYLKLCR